MKKLILTILLVNLSYGQKSESIYIILEDDFSHITKIENDKELVETYCIYIKESNLFNLKNGGFNFMHKKTKKVKFKGVEKKFWQGQARKTKNFKSENKIIIDKEWFNKYDEDLIFSFFLFNQDYNYYIVYPDKNINNVFWIKEAFFATPNPYNDVENENISRRNQGYQLKLCGDTFVMTVMD